MVDLTVVLDDFGNACVDRVLVGDIAVVGTDLGNPAAL